VPIIVAINKIDKPDANPTRVRTELLQHEIVVESMGGDTLDVEVSAKKGTNLDKLLEAILLQAEVLDLKANPTAGRRARHRSQARQGPWPGGHGAGAARHAEVGDIFVAGAEWGRVRALVNDKGEQVKEAGPSVPVEVLGFNGAGSRRPLSPSSRTKPGPAKSPTIASAQAPRDARWRWARARSNR
jgi:translation initiation factor IF-2